MRALSSAGQQAVNDLAQRHGFSPAAVLNMLDAVINGHGRMAQFNHPEFGGAGQWMQGGMTMVSDMFNNALKCRVDALCSDLSGWVANQPDLMYGGSFQSQSQGGDDGQQQAHCSGSQQQQNGVGSVGPVSLFVPPAPGSFGDWWGADLRWPTSTGAQHGVRYAYFAQARRLAIDIGGRVTLYDTLDHQIGGFAQQQGAGGSLTFSSQYGLVDVARLPVLTVDGVASSMPVASPTPPDRDAPSAPGGADDIFALLERLADLHAKGILSTEEFAAKKTELLSRL
ncbi:MAG: SHOCT domain-containing protein [Candidatus Competibacteraceae bacterium]